MRRILAITVATTLLVPTLAFARGGHGTAHSVQSFSNVAHNTTPHTNFIASSGMHKSSMSSHHVSLSFRGTSFSASRCAGGFCFNSRPSFWSNSCWSARYGCYCWWCPYSSCYYYYCAPYACYYPVSYCPTGSYAYTVPNINVLSGPENGPPPGGPDVNFPPQGGEQNSQAPQGAE